MQYFLIDNILQIIRILVRGVGIVLGVNALFQSRTQQGAMAWFIALVGFPFIAIPFYVAFGRRKYFEEIDFQPLSDSIPNIIHHEHKSLLVLEQFLRRTGSAFIAGNSIELLSDTRQIYESMLKEISGASNYIILQVYIFRTDEIGKMFAEALSERARNGVKVFLLYEKVLISMSKEVLQKMKRDGVLIGSFRPFERNKWNLNFRNHRKLLVIDGRVGFCGGVNIGDDYLGKYPQIGRWRDTNIKIKGPVLMSAQESFAKDWYSSQGYLADIDWNRPGREGNTDVFIFSSGPVEERPLCLLHHLTLINLAQSRLWIANPYIVPPQSLMDALANAALRGVDVKILVPQKNDNPFISAVSDIYYERLLIYGVKIFSYKNGFLHQKVMLIDHMLGVVGSANFDFRSMYINFEITAASSSPSFVKEMEQMLNDDFFCAEEVELKNLQNKSLGRKTYERVMNLFSPVL